MKNPSEQNLEEQDGCAGCFTAFSFACLFFMIAMILLMRTCDPDNPTKETLIENYEVNKEAIHSARAYFKHVKPRDKRIEIEFYGSEVVRLIVIPYKNRRKVMSYYGNNHNEPLDSLLQIIKWDKAIIETLRSKLDKANCIGIGDGFLNYQRGGLGMYSYNIYSPVIPDDVREYIKENSGCNFITYNDQVVLEYGGGAFGPQCFKDYKMNAY